MGMDSNINSSQEKDTSSSPASETSTSLSHGSTLPMLENNVMVAKHNLLSSFSLLSSSSSSNRGQGNDSSPGYTSTGAVESSSEAHLRPKGGIRFSGMRQVQEYQIHRPPQNVLPAREHQCVVPLEGETFRQSVGRSRRSSYIQSMRRQWNKQRVEEPDEFEKVSEEYDDNQEDREEDEEGDEEGDKEGAEEEGEMEGSQEGEEEAREEEEEEEEEKAIKEGKEEKKDGPSDLGVDEGRYQDVPEGEIVCSGDTGIPRSVQVPSLERDGSSGQHSPDKPPKQLEMGQFLSRLRPNRPSSESDPEDPSTVLDPGEPSGETSSQPPSENPGKRKRDSDEEEPCCLKCPVYCPRTLLSRSSPTLKPHGTTGYRASTSAAGPLVSSQTTGPTSLELVTLSFFLFASQPPLHLTSRTVFDPSSIEPLMLPPSTSQARPTSSLPRPAIFSLAFRSLPFSLLFRPLSIPSPIVNQHSTQPTIQFAITQLSAQPTTQSTTPFAPSMQFTQFTQFTQSTVSPTVPTTQRATQVQQTTLRQSARIAGRQVALAQLPRTRSASKRGRFGRAEQPSPKRKKN